MTSTTVLTGMLPFIVLAASVLAFPVCFLLLAAYRRSVRKAMAAAGAGAPSGREPDLMPSAPGTQLRIGAMNTNLVVDDMTTMSPTLRNAMIGPWRACAAYALAGLAYALVMTAGWLLATRDEALGWVKFLIIGWTYCWPAVLAMLLVVAYDRSRRLQLFGAYFAVLVILNAIAIARNPALGIVDLPLYWLIVNGSSTVLLLTFLLRPIRAVGPLVLVFLIAVAIGSQSLLSIAGLNDALLRAIAGFGFSIGLTGNGVFFGMIAVGMFAFASLGWPLLRILGQRYERKQFSDQSIMLDSMWLMFGVVQSIGLAFEAPPWILTGLVAFAAYKVVARFALAAVASTASGGIARTLLLLRVFALAKRSEQLFDKLRKHWQYAGSISMIAGPDLVTSTIEPHEFMAFLSGRLGRQFVSDRQDLEQRISTLDNARDPDGRFRINEFFCHADTWQMTMQRLAAGSDTVLMDLRSFAAANQGCIFELGCLLDSVKLERVIFLVDSTTDRVFLESTLQRLWQSVSAGSPNRSVASPVVRLFQIEQQSEQEMKALLRALIGTAHEDYSLQRH